MILNIILLLLSVTDFSLTFYYFYLMNKKGCFNPKEEKGILGRLLIKKGLRPHKFLIGLLVAMGIFVMVIHFDTILVPYFIGVLFTINMMHVHHISNVRKQWNKDSYWNLCKKIKGLK